MKILIIGNPIASGGNAAIKIKQLSAILRQQGHTVQAHLTRFAGDGKAAAARLAASFERIVVVGGDGTLNEIINGIPEGSTAPLLQLPTGNANLIARDLGLPKTATAAAGLLQNGQVIQADLATMNNRKFIMVAGAGFDARVTAALKTIRTGTVNNFSYIRPVLQALLSPSPAPYHVSVDGGPAMRGAMVLVCNLRNYAGICELADEAAIDSGVLDILILPGESLFSLVMYFLMSKVSRVSRLPGVFYRKGANIRITSKYPIPMQLDGDFHGRHKTVNIGLTPGAVPLVVPADFKRCGTRN